MHVVRSAELVFDNYSVVRFINSAGKNVGTKRANPMFYSLNLQFHVQRLPEQRYIFGLSKPRSKVLVLVRPSFC
jgi:hypothetical protein